MWPSPCLYLLGFELAPRIYCYEAKGEVYRPMLTLCWSLYVFRESALVFNLKVHANMIVLDLGLGAPQNKLSMSIVQSVAHPSILEVNASAIICYYVIKFLLFYTSIVCAYIYKCLNPACNFIRPCSIFDLALYQHILWREREISDCLRYKSDKECCSFLRSSRSE